MVLTSSCFIHRLLVTDAVVYVSENIPDSIPDRDLLESGDGAFIVYSSYMRQLN